MDEVLTYMGYEWVMIEDGSIVIGINEQGLDEFTEIAKSNLPAVDEEVMTDEVCGELETDQGPMNLYSPIEGTVVEVNEAVIENPSLIQEDCFGDGWLFKVEPRKASDLKKLSNSLSSTGDDEYDEDEE